MWLVNAHKDYFQNSRRQKRNQMHKSSALISIGTEYIRANQMFSKFDMCFESSAVDIIKSIFTLPNFHVMCYLGPFCSLWLLLVIVFSLPSLSSTSFAHTPINFYWFWQIMCFGYECLWPRWFRHGVTVSSAQSSKLAWTLGMKRSYMWCQEQLQRHLKGFQKVINIFLTAEYFHPFL